MKKIGYISAVGAAMLEDPTGWTKLSATPSAIQTIPVSAFPEGTLKDAARYQELKRTTYADLLRMFELASMSHAHGGMSLNESLDLAIKERTK